MFRRAGQKSGTKLVICRLIPQLLSVARKEIGPQHEESPEPSLLEKWADFVKISHTVFALPFALAATVLAARAGHATRIENGETASAAMERGWPGWQIFGLILLAMVTARTCAMAFNRIVDRKFDALNPRTKDRHLPSGQISLVSAWTLCLLSGALFIGTTYGIDHLRESNQGKLICFMLSPVTLFFILGYSFTKRFTDFTHVFLGIALAISPVGAWLAINGSLDFGGPIKYSAFIPSLLALIVVLWLIGFDTIYAIQDFEFDRTNNLHSIVVRWGPDNALNLALLVHIVMMILLVLFGLLAGFKMAYWIGMVIITACLGLEHWIARKRSLDWIQKAFFNLNAIISLVFMAMVITEVSIVPRFISWRLW